MAKYYDATKIKSIISSYKGEFFRAVLGIAEDWANTHETIFINDEFIVNISGEVRVSGISCSSWGTPEMRLIMNDNSISKFEVWKEL